MRGLLKPYQCRRYWDITNRERFASSRNPKTLVKAFSMNPGGLDIDEDLPAFKVFETLLSEGNLGIEVPQSAPADATPNERDEARERIIFFWRACAVHANPSVKRIGRAALRACSILISTACVEGSFSTISNFSTPNRLRGDDRYLYNLAMLTVNRAWVWKAYAPVISNVTSVLGMI
jgi:hypothetical protein